LAGVHRAEHDGVTPGAAQHLGAAGMDHDGEVARIALAEQDLALLEPPVHRPASVPPADVRITKRAAGRGSERRAPDLCAAVRSSGRGGPVRGEGRAGAPPTEADARLSPARRPVPRCTRRTATGCPP